MTDMMHSFELFQPASLSEANSLLDKYRVRFLLGRSRAAPATRFLPVERLGRIVESRPYVLHWIEPGPPDRPDGGSARPRE